MIGVNTVPWFDINRTEEYKLSIQVGLDGFSFSVGDIKQNEVIAFEDYHFKLSSDKFLGRHFTEWINERELLNKKYERYNVIYNADKFTFVPSAYYDNNLMGMQAGLVLGEAEDCNFMSNELEDGNLIFPASSRLLSDVKTLFPTCKVQHPLSILHRTLLKQANTEGTVLLVYFMVESFNLILYRDKRIMLTNSYGYHDSGDFLYYVLTAFNRLEVSPKSTTLFIAGEVSPLGKLYSDLLKYFLKTHFLMPEITVNRDIIKEPLYRHIVLF